MNIHQNIVQSMFDGVYLPRVEGGGNQNLSLYDNVINVSFG